MKISSLATLAAAIVAVGVSVAACGTTNNNAVEQSSALGESCAQTADCKVGVCVNQTCVMGPQTADGGGSSSGASSSGGSSGGSGSSSSSGGSSSGGSSSSSGGVAEAAAPHVSLRGDACQSTAQCAAGLACVVPPGGFGSGICDVSSFGLTASATGKTCTGECNTAADCCELPVNVVINAVTYHHCNDILNQVIGAASCGALAAGDSSAVGVGCFYYQTYCGTCTSANWTCTNNQCVYGASCMASGAVIQGCAPLTRLGNGLVTTCTNGTCSPPAAAGACTANADCAGKAYSPFPGIGATSNICRAPGATGSTDCVCQNGGCYLGCTKDLDCAKGYTCDSTKGLCKAVGSCTSNYQCAQQTGDVRSTCTSGLCTTPCSADLDCSPSGGTGGNFNGRVCVGATATTAGTCQALGCSADADCNTPGGAAARRFCITPAAMSAALEVSAITN